LMLLVITFSLGIVLTLIPLPSIVEWFRPHWLLLILIYWIRALPRSIGFLVAWILGFGLDSIQGGVIGQYPFIFIVVALLVGMTRNQSNYFSYVQQLMWVGALVGGSQLLSLAIASLTTGITTPVWYLSSSLASILAWPLVDGVLRTCYRLGWNARLQSTHYSL
jgi:rod shape-determining protein MreD